jgi:hypothetical protein
MLLLRRFGWNGEPPRTLAQLASEEGLKPAGIARRVQKAIRELRAVVRAAG